MKKFLAIHNYNSPYYGGLSSYSTVILIVAFMNCYGLRDGFSGAYYNRHENLYITQEEMTPARLLMCFLDFYSYMFNPSMLGISIAGNGSFF
jgi:DNA polymerase sigma